MIQPKIEKHFRYVKGMKTLINYIFHEVSIYKKAAYITVCT